MECYITSVNEFCGKFVHLKLNYGARNTFVLWQKKHHVYNAKAYTCAYHLTFLGLVSSDLFGAGGLKQKKIVTSGSTYLQNT